MIMQPMQLNYQDTMSDFMASFSYINQYHLYKQESDTTEDFLSASTMYEYPDPQVDTKLQLNENTLQYSYHISPSFAVDQTLEESYFDFDSLAEQEKELQKNLVKDVFFSPSIQESHAPCLLSSSCSSSQSGGDDNYSLMSDSSLTCASSPPYQYDDMVASVIDNEHNTTSSFSCTPQSCNDTEQFIFPCHLDLYHSVKDFEEPRPTTAYNNNNRSKKKTVKKPLVKTISNKTKKPRKSTKKTILSKVAVTNIQSTDTSSWEYKRSDNKYSDMLSDSTLNKPRSTCTPTIYQKFSKQSIDWCRYCGTTEGVNWRPGPWGKRTLCNKHGCDYKGYGFACKLPRLDLTGFTRETIDKRTRPVLQSYCSHCHKQESWEDNTLVLCDGCPKAYHQHCHQTTEISNEFIKSDQPWYCSEDCHENLKKKRVIVELPRKRLPLMRTPKNALAEAAAKASLL